MPTKILPQDISTSVDFNISELSLSDGTVSLPSLAFSSDQNTGFYRPASDILEIATGGTNALGITNSVIQIESGRVIQTVNNGTASAPVYSFNSEPGLGWYRGASGRMSLAAGTVEAAYFDLSAGYFSLSNNYNVSANPGTVSVPAYSFTGDLDTGIYRSGTNELSVTSNATLSATFVSTGTNLYAGGVETFNLRSQGVRIVDGSASAPSYSFITDTNTGIYRSATDQVAITCNAQGPHLIVDKTSLNVYASNDGSSVLRAQVAQEGLNMSNSAKIYNTNGNQSLPAYSFTGDTDTGFYWASSGDVRFSSDTTAVLFLNSTGITMNSGKIVNNDGSAALPAYTFNADPDTGIYRAGTNLLGLATNGIGQMFLNAGGGLRSVTYSQSFHDGGFGERVVQNQSTSVDYTLGGDFIGFVFVQTFNNVNTAHGSKLFWVASSATELSFTQLAAQGGQSGLITVTNPSTTVLRVALGATGTSNNGVMFMRINYAAG